MMETFHAGEVAVQALAGERDQAELNGRIIADTIPQGAVRFVEQQQMVVLGTVASDETVWASVLAGRSQFAKTDETRRHLFVSVDPETDVSASHPAFDALGPGAPIGTLFIELATRRRLRANGRIAAFDGRSLAVEIDEAYPNCPKYIQRRTMSPRQGARSSSEQQFGTGLDDRLRDWIRNADTFFVASANPERGVDVSHRGGPAGFVRLQDDVLQIPDYPGNAMFNTLGNFYLNPRAGLTFIDFECSRQLSLTGDVVLDFQRPETAIETGGSGRWWSFRPTRWVDSPLNIEIDWTYLDASPFNP
jgi:predicted pyridoxine 5'-phosphate oxidase superfamily flavin-nucleotide-binding protein